MAILLPLHAAVPVRQPYTCLYGFSIQFICRERELASYTYFLLLMISALASFIMCVPSYHYSYPTAEWQAVYEHDYFDGQSRGLGFVNVSGSYRRQTLLQL